MTKSTPKYRLHSTASSSKFVWSKDQKILIIKDDTLYLGTYVYMYILISSLKLYRNNIGFYIHKYNLEICGKSVSISTRHMILKYPQSNL